MWTTSNPCMFLMLACRQAAAACTHLLTLPRLFKASRQKQPCATLAYRMLMSSLPHADEHPEALSAHCAHKVPCQHPKKSHGQSLNVNADTTTLPLQTTLGIGKKAVYQQQVEVASMMPSAGRGWPVEVKQHPPHLLHTWLHRCKAWTLAASECKTYKHAVTEQYSTVCDVQAVQCDPIQHMSLRYAAEQDPASASL